MINKIKQVIVSESDHYVSAKNICGVTEKGNVNLSAVFSIRDIDDGTGGVELNINVYHFGCFVPDEAMVKELLSKSFEQFNSECKVRIKDMPEYTFTEWKWVWTDNNEIFITCREEC